MDALDAHLNVCKSIYQESPGSFRFQGCPVPCIPVRPVRSVQSVRCGSVLAVPSVPVSAVPVRFAAILKIVPRHKNRKGHENGHRESCGYADQCILHRILVRIIS